MKKKILPLLFLTVFLFGACSCSVATEDAATGAVVDSVAGESLKEPGTEQTGDTPTEQPIAETSSDATAEATADTQTETELTAEPTIEPTVEPTVEPTPEPTPEPTTEESTESITPTEEDTTMNTTIDTSKPLVALTFDDGPNTSTTVQVLDKLEEYGVTATFFLIGNNITASTEDVVKRTYDMGCEIANHSQTHSNMVELTAEEIQSEIAYVTAKVEEITSEPTRFFRPPYISVNDTMYENIDMPFICGVGCNDWEDDVTAEQRSEKTLQQVKDGTIILLHDFVGNNQTVEALDTIIPALLKEGYQFVTVSQLFEAKGVEVSGTDTRLHTVVE